jgi:hypothetical protein
MEQLILTMVLVDPTCSFHNSEWNEQDTQISLKNLTFMDGLQQGKVAQIFSDAHQS